MNVFLRVYCGGAPHEWDCGSVVAIQSLFKRLVCITGSKLEPLGGELDSARTACCHDSVQNFYRRYLTKHQNVDELGMRMG